MKTAPGAPERSDVRVPQPTLFTHVSHLQIEKKRNCEEKLLEARGGFSEHGYLSWQLFARSIAIAPYKHADLCNKCSPHPPVAWLLSMSSSVIPSFSPRLARFRHCPLSHHCLRCFSVFVQDSGLLLSFLSILSISNLTFSLIILTLTLPITDLVRPFDLAVIFQATRFLHD